MTLQILILSATIFITFLTATIFWLLVEAPLCQLFKILLNPQYKSFHSNKLLVLPKLDSKVEDHESRSKL